ncbi:MAG: D-tyrosyl-tRNA(Tyr) deacylase [Ruminococcaceae bacterium]|nr:D-tyrosyl-tRNA(Tyr) deacylase [Oscillospiraceae bacterium]
MRAVLQRTKQCTLSIEGKEYSNIKNGFLILLGVSCEDTEKEAELLCEKILRMRIFSDENGKMNLSVTDERVKGDLMVVSNFTLYANCKSRRPDFLRAGKPDEANRLYEYFIACLKDTSKKIAGESDTGYVPEIATGVFGADMQIDLVNDGPVTIILDTDELKNSGRSSI